MRNEGALGDAEETLVWRLAMLGESANNVVDNHAGDAMMRNAGMKTIYVSGLFMSVLMLSCNCAP